MPCFFHSRALSCRLSAICPVHCMNCDCSQLRRETKIRSSSTGICSMFKTIFKKVNHKPPASLGCVKVLLWFISVKLLEIAKCSPSPRPELISRAWAQFRLQQLLSIDGCQWQLASGFSSTPLELTSQRNLNHICPLLKEVPSVSVVKSKYATI